ncbi:MAG TPA: transposase [Kofleriaceae bacterium]|jgi:REP element-mobilizing transposase RayT
MAGRRARRRHVQQELFNAAGTAPKSKRGGKRRGAGRPASGPRPSERHKRRAAFKAYQPLHVTLRIVADVQPLRTKDIYAALRKATKAVAGTKSMRIVHVSVQDSYVHLLVEADDRTALSKGVQGFAISAAKHINAVIGLRPGKRRTGKVFADRYHVDLITTPRQMRNTLVYVFNNWRKHRVVNKSPGWRVDPFSTACLFDGWRDGACLDRERFPPELAHLVVQQAQTWLLRVGWRRHGLLDWRHVPSIKPAG